ncbi:MAG: helix-turn-helix transcriptional regulator [Thermoanaerobaculia bacterium]
MTTTEDAKVLSLTVVFLRFFADMTQAELGRAAGIDQGLISRYESGKHVPPEESLRRMAAAAGVPWSQVIFLRRAYSTILQATARGKAGGLDTEPLDAGALEISLERALLVVATYLAEETSRESSPEEERREAERIWEALEELPASRRRRLIELSLHAGRSWALAERLCEASLRTAAAEPEEALELADLALFIAGQVPGEEGWRSRVEGYCWAHVANARRAAGDLAGADEACARARDLWRAGAADPGLLWESRLNELAAEP